jgi:hypothetical protein
MLAAYSVLLYGTLRRNTCQSRSPQDTSATIAPWRARFASRNIDGGYSVIGDLIAQALDIRDPERNKLLSVWRGLEFLY